MPGYAFATGMEFAAPAVDVLCAQGDPPALLIGYPPGLQHRSGYAPLAAASAKHGIPLLETSDINDGQALAYVSQLGLDLFVIAGWSQLIREPLLSACPLGAIGLHPTRLPSGRGRAPLPWTIIKGITSSAVTLFFLKPGVDDGDIIDQAEFTVTRRDDVAAVYRKVTEINIALLAKHIPAALRGEITPTPQPPGGSVWPKRRPSDGTIDWARPASEVYDWIRALSSPYPGAFTTHRGRRLWIHTADLLDTSPLQPNSPHPHHAKDDQPETGPAHQGRAHHPKADQIQAHADQEQAERSQADQAEQADRAEANQAQTKPGLTEPGLAQADHGPATQTTQLQPHQTDAGLVQADHVQATEAEADQAQTEPDLAEADHGLAEQTAEAGQVHAHQTGAGQVHAGHVQTDQARADPLGRDLVGPDLVGPDLVGRDLAERVPASSSPSRPGARFPTGRAETPESGQFRPDIHSSECLVEPGRVMGTAWSTSVGGLVVACARGTVIIREVQWEGGPRLDALALFEGGELAVGERLGVT